MRERRVNTDERRWIPCRECCQPLVLEADRMQRLAGRTYIECRSCRNLIWIRRGDMREALPVGAGLGDSEALPT